MIQQGLVAMGDKPDTFLGSRNWIGSFEVCITIDHLYDVSVPLVFRVFFLINHTSFCPNIHFAMLGQELF